MVSSKNPRLVVVPESGAAGGFALKGKKMRDSRPIAVRINIKTMKWEMVEKLSVFPFITATFTETVFENPLYPKKSLA
jgi:hypothetical protein